MDSPSSTSKKEVVNDVDDSSSHDQKQTRLKSQDGDDLIHSSGDKGTVEINSPVQRDLDDLIRDLLPAELKLAVLKEKLRLWAIHVFALGPLRLPPFHNRCYGIFGYLHVSEVPTSRALLIHLPTGLKKEFESRRFMNRRGGYVDPVLHRVGWCMLPKGIDHPDAYKWEVAVTTRESDMAESTVPISQCWDPVRISKILEPAMDSKEFYGPLKSFLLGHITWEFHHQYFFYDMVENPVCRLSRETLKAIKHICLEIGTSPFGSWGDFVPLFEYVFKVLSEPDNPLLNLKVLEIRGSSFEAKQVMLSYLKCRVVDEKIRMRYLVTRCYQLVKILPHITIVLTGTSNNWYTKVDPAVLPRVRRHRVLDRGWMHSWAQEKEFFNKASDAHGPRLEISKPEKDFRGEYPLSYRFQKLHHWKILFVEEWETIWRLGLQAPGSTDSDKKKYYDAVTDPSGTFNIDGIADNFIDELESDGEDDYEVTWHLGRDKWVPEWE